MRRVLFIQGGGARVHDDWDAKLAESLRSALGSGFDVRYPRMPNEADPSYAAWAPAIADEIAKLGDGSVVVGHSIGGTILVHALAERPPAIRLGAIVLVAAPFVGEGGWPSGDWTPRPDFGSRLPAGVPVYLFHGLADEIAPAAHAELYARAIPGAKLRLLPGRDHQLGGDLSEVAAVIRGLRHGA